MRDGEGYLITNKLAKKQSLLLVAGRTEPTRFTTEGQEHLMTTVLTSDPGETTTQISTFQKLLQNLFYHRSKIAIFPLLLA